MASCLYSLCNSILAKISKSVNLKNYFSVVLFSVFVVFYLQIVDLSLLVKQEMTAKSNPISHVISASYIHYNTHTEVLAGAILAFNHFQSL